MEEAKSPGLQKDEKGLARPAGESIPGGGNSMPEDLRQE